MHSTLLIMTMILACYPSIAQADQTCDINQAKLDVILMLDSSNRVSKSNFRKLTAYLGNFFSAFNISPSGTRVAITGNFGQRGPVAFLNLAESADLAHLRSVLNGLPHRGGRNYGITINSFWSHGISTFANRPEAADVIIIFSASAIAGFDPVFPLKDFGIKGGRVVTVAMGGLHAGALAPLASDARYATAVSDYDRFGQATDFLVNAMCDARCWTHGARTVLSDGAGSFHSALYPHDYCNNLASHHVFLSAEPMRVNVRIPHFALVGDDHADFHNGLYRTDVNRDFHDEQDIDLLSNWNQVEMHLQTDESDTAQGFSGAYRTCMPGLFKSCAPFVSAKSNLTATSMGIGNSPRVVDEVVRQSEARRKDRPVVAETKERAETAGATCNPKTSSWDIILMLDSSGDMDEGDFNGLIDFLRFTFFPQFMISQAAHRATRVGIVIPYNDLDSSERLGYLTLVESTDLAAVQHALQNVPYLDGDTYDNNSTVLAWGMFTPPSHNRPQAADVIMWFTASRPQEFRILYGFGDFKLEGGRVIAVGVGSDVAATDLQVIASHTFHVDNAGQLAGINVDLVNALCDDRCYPSANQVLTAPSGVFSTPFFPADYCNNLNANYFIALASPLTIDLTIPRLSTEECCDHLEIFSGANVAEPEGSHSGSQTNIHERSANGMFYLKFTSDEGTPGSGFEVNYKACMPGLFNSCVA